MKIDGRKTAFPCDGFALKKAIKSRMKLYEAAELLGIHKNQLWEWTRQGNLCFYALVALREKFSLSPREMREIMKPSIDALGLFACDPVEEFQYGVMKQAVSALQKHVEREIMGVVEA